MTTVHNNHCINIPLNQHAAHTTAFFPVSALFIYNSTFGRGPITVAARSKALTVFAHSDTRVVSSNPTQAWMFASILCSCCPV
jgi:hypothetical protein